MRNKSIKLLMLIFLIAGIAHAQTERSDFRIRYIVNNPNIDSTYLDNTEKIANLKNFLSEIKADSTLSINKVNFKGTASPEGGYEFNIWLSENRLRTFKELVSEYVTLPDSIIMANVTDITWDDFRTRVAQSDVPGRQEVLEIIDEGQVIVPWFNDRHIDRRLLKLKKLQHGSAWKYLQKPILQDLRYGEVQFFVHRELPKYSMAEAYLHVPMVGKPEMTISPNAFLSANMLKEDRWVPRLHLKSNLLGWMLLISNIGVEVDIARHFSVNIPFYYSAWDYFSETTKFRTLALQPALRYWPNGVVNEGFFVNAHGTLAYFNLATGSRYRRQDHDGHTPALGGGIGVGYRFPIGKRWHLEFEVGVGAYKLDYDLFDNIDPTIHGQLAGREKRVYFGPDQASVSFTYAFDLKPRIRKGGVRK